MAKDYIPRSNSLFNIFQTNLVKAAVANATGWSIPADEVAELADAGAEYGEQYKHISNKGNCTTAQRAGHNSFRKDYEKQIRQFVNRYLRDNKNISSSQLVGMSIPVREKKRQSRPAITDLVELMLLPMAGCRVKLVGRVPNREGKASLHPESDGIEFAYSIGTKPANYNNCEHRLVSKKASTLLTLEPDTQGKIIYVYARYVNLNNHNLSGPWCAIKQVMLH